MPGSAITQVFTINDANVWHAFTLDTASNTFDRIDVPGASFTQVFGINDDGLVAVQSDLGSYIYCPRKPSRCPAGGTEIPDRRVAAAGVSRNPHARGARPADARDRDGIR